MRLSVVVVVYNMTREAPRTLLSLSPSYQRNVDEEDYEVIVVENGSTQRLDPVAVARLGGNFRYHNMENASPSPAGAINFGMRQARGEVVGVMIDGARVCTPGVLEHALTATRTYPRAVVATPGYYMGFGSQRFAMQNGHTPAFEDGLFEKIGWPADGYRLFEVGSIDESSHYFQPLAESNALFMPRTLWNELGGIDERFDLPGGGIVNHDTLNRASELPDAELVILLGEATFHQVHGGVATNSQMDVFEPRFRQWMAEYKQIRGVDYHGSQRRRCYLGHLPDLLRHHLQWELNDLNPPPFAEEHQQIESQLAEARAEVARLANLAEAERAERERLRHELDLLKGSTSWSLTRPLRTAFRTLSVLRSRKPNGHE